MGAFAAAALLTACSNDSTDSGFEGQGNEVLVKATIGNAVTRTSPAATDNTAFSNNDKISVSNGKSTLTYTYNAASDTWTPPTGKFLKWETKQGTFQAFYPDNGQNTYKLGILAQYQDGVADFAASDYMKGTYDYSSIPSDRTLSLKMERQTALVVIDKDFEYGNEFDGKNPTIEDLFVMSSLYVPTDNNLEAIASYTDADGYRYAIVAPTASMPDETFIRLSVKTGSTSKTLTIKGVPDLVAGKRYHFKLHVGKEVATIGSVKVKEWEDGSSITGKAAFKYAINGNTITLPTSGILEENPSLIEQTIGTGSSLVVKGTIDRYDLEAINEYIKNCGKGIDLDLSGTTITSIGGFADNENLNAVRLPKTLTSIENEAFNKCTNAKFPNLGELTSIKDIGNEAFKDTQLSGSLTFPNLESIGNAAFEGTNINQITFPKTITEVPGFLFSFGKSSVSVVFEGKLTYIGRRAFSNAYGMTIDISACDNVPTCDEDAFYKLSSSSKIIVKASLLSAFQAADVWKDIASQLVGK